MRIAPDLVRVREGSREQSVVFLPGLGDPVSGMAPLASRIGGAGAVYILDLVRLTESAREPLTVERLAEQGLAAVNGLGGVDAFIGYSFGGLVAFEMKRLAGTAGDAKPVAILIDAAPDQSQWPRATWLYSLWIRTLLYTKSLAKLSPRQAVAEFGRRTHGLIGRIAQRRAALKTERATLAEEAGGSAQRPSAASLMYRALLFYWPMPYGGCLSLIESSDPSFATPVSKIWRPLVADLRVLQYSGGHLDAVRSDACLDSLAAQLNACLGVAP